MVLVLTTSAHQRDVQAAYEQHAAAYVLKTDDDAKIGRLIESYLDAVHLPNSIPVP